MNVTLICFSLSGNTRTVADALADTFRETGHSTRVILLQDAAPEDTDSCDLLGVGTACFSGQAPTPIKSWLRSLPQLDGRRAFVFATSSGAPGRVLYDLARLLRNKGARVLGGFLARGEVHHPAPHMTGQFTGHPDAEDLARAQHFASALAEHASQSRPGRALGTRPDSLKHGRDLYGLLGKVVSDSLLRLIMPEPQVDPVACEHCGTCISECPMNTFTLERMSTTPSHPTLGERCIRCYHCLTACPSDALDVDWRFADRLLLLLYSPTLIRWFGDLEPGERIR
jgi:ferredoxin/flavodoxin